MKLHYGNRFGKLFMVFLLLLHACTSDDAPGPAGPDLEQKIGQMLMLGFRGMAIGPGDQIYDDIASGRIGGVVLFDRDVALGFTDRNIESPQQVLELNSQLASAAPVYPLLISVDQEGGRVARLKEEYGFPATVTAAYLGTLNNVDSTRFYGQRIATTLSTHGFNVNLAPVVDVNINPESPAIGAIERSFSEDPDLVTLHAGIVVEEHRKEQVLTTLKHFPGHGSAQADSHFGFTDVTHTWQESELLPYQNLIEQGKADMIMTAHIYNANWDADYPATMSRHVITGMLRQQLGFEGVIISDDMNMGAITDHYGLEEAIFRSIDAGVDILIFANNLVYDELIALKATGIILDLISEGYLTESRIEESYQRIMTLKEKL
ncbi:MAG: glycoside hydrolase family 3 protein [Bacteroidales bacterium]|nr:glycoside hydrolase family 3 protein [Bacteroidales bacterium]